MQSKKDGMGHEGTAWAQQQRRAMAARQLNRAKVAQVTMQAAPHQAAILSAQAMAGAGNREQGPNSHTGKVTQQSQNKTAGPLWVPGSPALAVSSMPRYRLSLLTLHFRHLSGLSFFRRLALPATHPSHCPRPAHGLAHAHTTHSSQRHPLHRVQRGLLHCHCSRSRIQATEPTTPATLVPRMRHAWCSWVPDPLPSRAAPATLLCR